MDKKLSGPTTEQLAPVQPIAAQTISTRSTSVQSAPIQTNEPRISFQEVDSARRKYAKKLLITLSPALIMIMVIFITMIVKFFTSKHISIELNSEVLTPICFLIVISIICAILFATKEATLYKELYKEYFVRKSLDKLFTNVEYFKHLGIPSELIYSTGMIRRGNKYSSNDYLSARYKNVGLIQSDVRIAHKSEDTETLYFLGRWFRFEFPKPFNFRLQVVEKRFFSSKTPSKDYKTGKTFQRIKTESHSFNQKFKIYAEDGFEAFYILDPAFIEHIEALEGIHKGKIILCFVDNYLHVGIKNNKDAFEPPNPFIPLNELKEIGKVSKDIKPITDFVDYLKLDRKLFKS